MKNRFIFITALVSFFTLSSCKNLSEIKSSNTSSPTTEASINKTHNEIIKEQKKKQSEADLPYRGLDLSKRPDVIAFGSCADQDQPQPLWSTIEKQNPDLFLFMGDNVYASRKEQKPISEQYKKLNKISEYRSLREKVPFLAIWDDHDFGQNDGGASNPEKEIARNDFLKYWTYLKPSLPKDQKALYHSRIIGSKKQNVQIILLDTRWDRSDLKPNPDELIEINGVIQTPVVAASTDLTKTTSTIASNDNTTASLDTTKAALVTVAPKTEKKYPRPYLSDNDKTKHFLSEEQWTWLEQELKKPTSFKVLVSSIQVIANDHQFEKWGNFPKERERLFNLLKKTKTKNLVILSGDRHAGSIAQYNMNGLGKIYDVTASGLNKPAKPGNILNDSSYLKEAFPEINFGLITFDWPSKTAKIELRSIENKVVNSIELKF